MDSAPVSPEKQRGLWWLPEKGSTATSESWLYSSRVKGVFLFIETPSTEKSLHASALRAEVGN